MSDKHRKYPVNYLVVHHSVGPELKNSTSLSVQDWYDNAGRNRGYKGRSRSYHNHPSRNKETFTQAHYALREYTVDKNKYGWQLTPLLKDIMNNVCWHCGVWSFNQKSIGIETCGDYRYKTLPDKAMMLIADTFRKHDKTLSGTGLQIVGHKELAATTCPANIQGQLPTLIDMFNNPDKWNKKLWPVTPPKPEPKPPVETMVKVQWKKDDLTRYFDKDGKQIGAYKNNIATENSFLKKEVEKLREDVKSLEVTNDLLANKVDENNEVIKTLEAELKDCQESGGGDCTEKVDRIDENVSWIRKQWEKLIGAFVDPSK